MAKCNPCSSKGRFACALLVGSFLSTFWFCLHYSLTRIHEKDSEIINFTGSLRYHTQTISTMLLSHKYLSAHSPIIEDPFQQLGKIVDALLGRARLSKDSVSDVADIEMIDEDVKRALEEWVSVHIHPLQVTSASLGAMSEMQIARTIDSVNAAIGAVDNIVFKAAAASDRRVHILMIVSVVRAIMGLLWAVVVSLLFGNVWRPYVTTYNRLQVLEQQSASILRAAFDAVVAVSAAHPFNVIACSETLDHLLGRSMQGKSLLSCAEGPVEEQELVKLLGLAQQAHEQHRSRFSRLDRLCWWNMLPQTEPERLPVAAMISTHWRCGPAESPSRVKVEVLAVSKPGRHCSTLLVVRRAPGDLGQMSPVPEEAALRPGAVAPAQVHVPIAIQAQAPTTPSAASRPRASSQSNSTGATAAGPLAGALSPRSWDLEQTPPPSVIGAATTRQRQLGSELALALASAVQGIPREARDNSSSSDATHLAL